MKPALKNTNFFCGFLKKPGIIESSTDTDESDIDSNYMAECDGRTLKGYNYVQMYYKLLDLKEKCPSRFDNSIEEWNSRKNTQGYNYNYFVGDSKIIIPKMQTPGTYITVRSTDESVSDELDLNIITPMFSSYRLNIVITGRTVDNKQYTAELANLLFSNLEYVRCDAFTDSTNTVTYRHKTSGREIKCNCTFTPREWNSNGYHEFHYALSYYNFRANTMYPNYLQESKHLYWAGTSRGDRLMSEINMTFTNCDDLDFSDFNISYALSGFTKQKFTWYGILNGASKELFSYTNNKTTNLEGGICNLKHQYVAWENIIHVQNGKQIIV